MIIFFILISFLIEIVLVMPGEMSCVLSSESSFFNGEGTLVLMVEPQYNEPLDR